MTTCLIIILIILFLGFVFGKTEEVTEGVFTTLVGIFVFLFSMIMTAIPIVIAVLILAWLFS